MGRKKKQTTYQWVREDLREPEPDLPEEEEEDDYKSRTQRRDEARSLDELAQQLIGMDAGMRSRLQLSDALLEALALAKRISSHEASRRQMQFIGRLLRTEDADAIREAIEDGNADARRRDRSLSQWHRRILDEGSPAIEAFLQDHPLADRQRLRGLWRAAARDTKKEGALLSYLYEAVPLQTS